METIRDYKCLSCSAPIHFDPTLQKWKCDYCKSVFTKQDLDNYYGNQDETPVLEMDSYHCENCGAEIVADPNTVATFCLYCKSPAIIKARLQGEFNPKYVIPFKITQSQAQELYATWIKKHFLAPKQFKLDEEIEKIRGVYAPFWLYNCDQSEIYVKGVGEVDRIWTSGDTEYTETSYYSVIREGEVAYDKLPIDGSSKMEDQLMEAIEPFDYEEMVNFSMDYMSGFFAERFDETKENLEQRAKNRMDSYSEYRVKETINYSRFKQEKKNIVYQHIDADYSLLPIYLLTNIYNGKAIQYIVNGQTGKIYGEVPISKIKLAGIFVSVFLVAWLIIGLLGIFS